MKITLPREQREWLEAEVESGRFSSIDEALAVAVADLMSIHGDDLSWARTYVDKARASLARGDVVSAENYFARLHARAS